MIFIVTPGLLYKCIQLLYKISAKSSRTKLPALAWQLGLFHYLHDIFIGKGMVFTNLLWIMLDGASPYHGVFKIFDELFVNGVTKVFNCRMSCSHDHWLRVVRKLILWFGISSSFLYCKLIWPDTKSQTDTLHSKQGQVFPHLLRR